jgi:hypothetical protein
MKLNNQQTIDLFQEAFNVMIYSFNREYDLNDDRAKPTLSVPEENKNLMNPDFCYATFSLREYFENNPSIYKIIKKDLKRIKLRFNQQYKAFHGDFSIFRQLRTSCKYAINSILGDRMVLNKNEGLDCIMLGNTGDECPHLELTSHMDDCYCCPRNFECISLPSDKFQRIFDFHNSGDIIYSYWNSDDESSADCSGDEPSENTSDDEEENEFDTF